MTNLLKLNSIITLGLLISTNAFGDEHQRVRHFSGEKPATTREARVLLSDYNAKLASILAKNELASKDLGEIHMLTYTLENAIMHLRQDLKALANTLEELHKLSEHNKPEQAKQQAEVYLQAAQQFTD